MDAQGAPIGLSARMAGLINRITYLRYTLASLVALGVDMGLFLLLIGAAMLPALASAIGYSIGILVHWLISSRLVWKDETRARGAGRREQKTLFVASALAGLAVTTAIVALGDIADFDARLSKLLAIVVSFHLTYWLRRTLIFRA